MELKDLKPERLVAAAIDHVLFDEFKRIDGDFWRKDKHYKFKAYRVKEMVRIDTQGEKP